MQGETEHGDLLDAPTCQSEAADDDVVYLENPYAASKADISELYRQIIARLMSM
jgi:hypothetical protein